MTTAAPSTALATIQPAFTNAERLALAGYLAGYRGLTRDAYALDLRQFTTWCRTRSLALFAIRRADIESFARDLEAKGRARATVTRRLCTATSSERCWSPPGSARRLSTRWSRCSPWTGFGYPRRLGPTSSIWASNAGTQRDRMGVVVQPRRTCAAGE